MTKNLDENVGRILDHLKRRGLERNTMVIFASDNGGYVGSDPASGRSVPVTNNAPLRSGKGSLYEGGIRVPLDDPLAGRDATRRDVRRAGGPHGPVPNAAERRPSAAGNEGCGRHRSGAVC